ncbi:prolyl-tRNA synthetase [Candidatus Saccharibacteria bacterium]|nr:prolyl-tRNA synthetase [Candidatus Saccharibacteria bacterium]
MRLSKSFVKTFREVGKEETARNAELLIKAGYINKEMAGVYSYLPLGLRVLRKIEDIIREELDAIGCEEIQMTALQNPEPWEKSGRWNSDKMDIWFKTDLSSGGQLGLAPTHEEPITNMMKKFISSYKDLPVYAYQFQTKFRNELRAKSGILRTREFLMKDLYSFTTSEEEHNKFYEDVTEAYYRIYDRLGIGDDTYKCFASGGVFSKYSHEFQTFLPVGEDKVYYNKDKSVVLNEEVLNDEVLADLKVKRKNLKETTAAEVGNIFTLKYKFSEPLDLEYNDKDGKRQTVFMGCYGIGVSRVMGVIVEKYADEKGLVWPMEIAPYHMYIIGIGKKGEKLAEMMYEDLQMSGQDIAILDDRDISVGQKFNDADLMGIPYRIVVSDKTIEKGGYEMTRRDDGKTTFCPLELTEEQEVILERAGR